MPEREDAERPAVRSFWSGTITFGLVSIPVDFFPAVRDRRTSMKMVDRKGNPLGREYYSEEDEEGLSADSLTRGYETADGEMVVVTDEELDSIAPDMTRDIDLRLFVPREQIPPPYYQRPYFLAPSGRSQKAYHLLAQTMRNTGRVGIGTFVMRGHQYLVAILSDGKWLRAETLRFAAELRSPQDVGLPKRKKPSRKAVSRFSDAVAALTRDALDMDELSDRYAEAIQDLVRTKEKKGKDIIDSFGADADDEEEGGGDVVDMMALLERSLAGKAKRSAKDGRHDGSGDSLEKLPRQELYERAKKLHIPGRSKMAKGQLVKAIQRSG